MKKQKDNSTFKQKATLRRKALDFLPAPVVMETHGGRGELFKACYRTIETGIVFEKNPDKSRLLGLQRPTWRVYEAECEQAIRDGVGGDLPINLLDVDPYGDPWPAIGAFFESERERASRLCVAVNDGLRKSSGLGKSWNVGSLQGMVRKYGNNLYPIYLDICQELLKEKANEAGYSLIHFGGYYCGHARQMTHYLAVLER